MWLFIVIAGCIAAGFVYEAIGAARDRRRFPAPGRLFNVGGSHLHINIQGTGSPVVVLEAGVAGSSLGWALVQPELARFTCTAAYDRAGLGWSAPCHAPRTPEQMVSELNELLLQANLPPPYVLVGHSFGGLLIRAYASAKPDQIAGLVFVDPVSLSGWAECSPENLRRLRLGVKLSRRGAMLARIGVVRGALAVLSSGKKTFPKLIARATARQAAQTLSRLVGEVQKLPPEVRPMIRSHWSRSKCMTAMAAYLEALPASAAAVARRTIPPHIPFIILSAGNATPREVEERDELVRQSQRGRHLRVDGAGHWVQLERPDVVLQAVRELVRSKRAADRQSAGA